MNHSQRFWAEVERILPDYKAPEKVARRSLEARFSREAKRPGSGPLGQLCHVPFPFQIDHVHQLDSVLNDGMVVIVGKSAPPGGESIKPQAW